MKKSILVIGLVLFSNFLFIHNTQARAFNEEQFASKFDLYVIKSKNHLRKNFKKITDDSGNPFYEVSPTSTSYFNREDYELKLSHLDKESLKRISKIMYFGYGYENRKTNAYYFATQYLIYKTFSEVETNYELNEVEANFMENEIKEIEADIKSVTFSLENFVIKESFFEIKDAYILDNFTVKGDNIAISYKKDKIRIDFLNKEKENYELQFIPKNSCDSVYIWNSINMELLNRGNICEKEYKINVQIEKETGEEKEEQPDLTDKIEDKTEENDKVHTEVKPEESTNEPTKEEIVDVIEIEDSITEVNVPSTGKNSFFIFEILYFLGSFYYVFKK